ncbi:hypothetical protein [Nostoc sp.]
MRILQLIQGRGNPDLPATVAFSHEQRLSTLAPNNTNIALSSG